jgi:hypothetical protein
VEEEGRARITIITGMGKKYCKREANTNINKISVMKKGDKRFKESNHKWAGKKGGSEHARNKKEDEVAKVYKLLPVKFSMGIKQIQITEV